MKKTRPTLNTFKNYVVLVEACSMVKNILQLKRNITLRGYFSSK